MLTKSKLVSPWKFVKEIEIFEISACIIRFQSNTVFKQTLLLRKSQ